MVSFVCFALPATPLPPFTQTPPDIILPDDKPPTLDQDATYQDSSYYLPENSTTNLSPGSTYSDQSSETPPALPPSGPPVHASGNFVDPAGTSSWPGWFGHLDHHFVASP